jgi:hypothetical protein
MNSKGNIDRKVCAILQRLDAHILSPEISIRDLKNIKGMVPMLISGFDLRSVTPPCIVPKRTATTNGKSLSLQALANLNKDNYDIVLNCIDRTLMARKDPDRHSKLEKCDCKNLGRDRLKLLRYMLEHPTVPICEETMSYVYGDTASMSANALAHSILAVRGCLWQAPYIITVNDWGESVSRTGSAYVLNEKYQYLVIRWQI